MPSPPIHQEKETMTEPIAINNARTPNSNSHKINVINRTYAGNIFKCPTQGGGPFQTLLFIHSFLLITTKRYFFSDEIFYHDKQATSTHTGSTPTREAQAEV